MFSKAAGTLELAATIGLFGFAALSTMLAVIGGLILFQVVRASDLLPVLSGFIQD